MGKRELMEILDVNEGIENRIIEALSDSYSLEDFIKKVKTKRYLYTRIQRIICHTLLGIKKDLEQNTPFAKILAMNTAHKEVFRAIKEKSTIPLISKPADYKKLLNSDSQAVFEKDVLATKLYSMFTKPYNDFTQGIEGV